MSEAKNTWPGGARHAMHQSDHERWNASNYPGTRQPCAICDEPTGRCEEDPITICDIGPLCEACYEAVDMTSQNPQDSPDSY